MNNNKISLFMTFDDYNQYLQDNNYQDYAHDDGLNALFAEYKSMQPIEN